MNRYKVGDEYYVECHTSFTYRNGKLIIGDEFDDMCIKGFSYKMTIEQHDEYNLSCWIKYGSDDSYGPGARFMFEGNSDNWVKYHYSDFFITLEQTKRDKKINELLNDTVD